MNVKNCMFSMMFAFAVAAFSISNAVPVWAVESGTYLVTVRPSYADPETGKVDDPGNNEAIGQGMCERMCGSTGLLEVDESGTMHLTVRYYLSQFIRDVTFEERISGSYTSRTFSQMQTKAPVEGASDVGVKYGYTDYRIPINDVNSVFRGNAYIDAMGRSVVYFFTITNPVSGSGDFVTSNQGAGQTFGGTDMASVAGAQIQVQSQAEPEGRNAESLETGVRADSADDEAEAQPQVSGQQVSAPGFDEDGRGDADAPVTGIPEKPAKLSAGERQAVQSGGPATEANQGTDQETDQNTYHLQTAYDLSAVPLQAARAMTEPMLEAAVGITAISGTAQYQTSAAALAPEGTISNPNKMIMLVLLAAAAALMAHFGYTTIMQRRNRRLAGRRQTEPGGNLIQNQEYRQKREILEQQYREAAARLERQYQETGVAGE